MLKKNIFCKRWQVKTLLIYLFLTGAPAKAKYDPDLRFRTIKTEHFYIHFHQNQEERAQALAHWAEKKYAELVSKTLHEPFFRTHVVLSDITDSANGFASFEPWNRIEMFAARPLPDSTIGYYRNWDEMLFVHEYNHILTLEQIYGLPGISRYLLGRVWFPNTNQPEWIIEGSAVAEESAEGFGRNNSAIVEMYFRAEAEGNDLKSINRASVPIRDWPAGHVHYFYGGRFAAWLEKKFPGKSLNHIHRENADNVWPYLNNTNSVDVFGKRFTDLWEEWLEELEKEQRAALGRIKATPLTPLTRLTSADFYQTFPRFADANTLYFLRENNYERATLQKIALQDPKYTRQKVRELNAPLFLTVQQQVPYVVDLEYYRSFSLFADIFDATKEQQLTERVRAVSLDIMPNGDFLLITQEAGLFTLGVHDAQGRRKETLLGPTTRTLAHARISPQGDAVVFTARDANTAANHLFLLQLKTREVLQLTGENTTDLHPAFSADGSTIVFSSNQSGVFNLHELDLKTGELRRLTHLAGGAFYPDYSPDGTRIALAEFGFPGYRIALYDRNQPPVEKRKSRLQKVSAESFALPRTSRAQPSQPGNPYSVVPSILPSSWSPSLYLMNDQLYELGAEVYGLDAIARDFVGVSLFQNFYSQSTRMTVAYENSHYYPDFFLAPSVKAGGTCGGICNAEFSAGALIPFLKFYRRQYLYLRGHYEYDREFALQDAHGLIGYSFSNTQLFARSVSPENGRRVGVSAYINHHHYYEQDPRYSRTFVYSFAEYAEYLPGFFRNNVFMLRAMWAHSWNVGDGFLLWQPYTYYDDFDFLRIRGYRQGFRGQGLFLGTLEYRFPLYQPDWGFFRVPFFFRDFYGKFFFDVAQAYYLAPRPSPSIQRSAGAELGLANIFGYRYMWSAYLGYARGFDEQGEHQVYFGIVGFTGVLWAKYSPHSEFH